MRYINLILAIVILSSFASAQDQTFQDQIVKYNTNSVIRFSCEDTTGQPCDSTVICNITIYKPNNEQLVSNELSTYESLGRFYYNVNTTQTQDIGIHRASAICVDGTSSGLSSFNYIVTASGDYGNLTFFAISVVLVLALLIFGFYKQDITITALANIGVYIIAISILINGIDIYYNSTTDVIGVVLLAIAFYLSYRVGMEYIG